VANPKGRRYLPFQEWAYSCRQWIRFRAANGIVEQGAQRRTIVARLVMLETVRHDLVGHRPEQIVMIISGCVVNLGRLENQAAVVRLAGRSRAVWPKTIAFRSNQRRIRA
jgi:hypothetical protein